MSRLGLWGPVMVLPRWFGLSDREAVAGSEFDMRWKYGVATLFLTLRRLLSTGWLWTPFVVGGVSGIECHEAFS